MMIIPKKLQVIRDSEILKEVSDELGFKASDVKRTYDIWLEFLEHIANETDQATITIPNIGQMYVCVSKLRRGLNSEKMKRFKERKLEEIKKTTEKMSILCSREISTNYTKIWSRKKKHKKSK